MSPGAPVVKKLTPAPRLAITQGTAPLGLIVHQSGATPRRHKRWPVLRPHECYQGLVMRRREVQQLGRASHGYCGASEVTAVFASERAAGDACRTQLDVI